MNHIRTFFFLLLATITLIEGEVNCQEIRSINLTDDAKIANLFYGVEDFNITHFLNFKNQWVFIFSAHTRVLKVLDNSNLVKKEFFLPQAETRNLIFFESDFFTDDNRVFFGPIGSVYYVFTFSAEAWSISTWPSSFDEKQTNRIGFFNQNFVTAVPRHLNSRTQNSSSYLYELGRIYSYASPPTSDSESRSNAINHPKLIYVSKLTEPVINLCLMNNFPSLTFEVFQNRLLVMDAYNLVLKVYDSDLSPENILSFHEEDFAPFSFNHDACAFFNYKPVKLMVDHSLNHVYLVSRTNDGYFLKPITGYFSGNSDDLKVKGRNLNIKGKINHIDNGKLYYSSKKGNQLEIYFFQLVDN